MGGRYLTDKKSKLASGSIITLLGSIILRFGGFIYRFILSRLLSTTGYGIVGLTLPFQNIFIIGASGGVPPAIAKYVSQYKAVDNQQMVHQMIKTGMKMMVFMSIIAALIMFIISEPVAIGMWHKPEALLPLRLVSLIIPFSVIVGAIRGVLQGLYDMKSIFYTKFIEQIGTIVLSSLFVILGWYAAGAVMGTALGFLCSLLGSYYLYKKDMNEYYSTNSFEKISFKEEISIMVEIFKFSIPVVISGVAEIFLYDTGTFFIGMYLPSLFAGFFTNASAIARIPLIIANSVSMSILPATSEADSLADKNLLKMYMHQSYRYTTVTSLPLSAFIMEFSTPVMVLLFGKEYAPGGAALWILVGGMFFFSLYLIASSMCQGLGKPSYPMYALIIAAIVNVIGSFTLIPMFDITGAALSTTFSTFVLMLITIGVLTRESGIHLPYMNILKMLIATVIMLIIMSFIPKTIIGMIIGGIIGFIAYIITIVLIKAIKYEDVELMEPLINKTGPLKKILIKIVDKSKNYLKE